MAFARVVTFENVSSSRIDEIAREMTDSDRPENVPATETLVLHDVKGEKALVILLFDTEEDYAIGDAVLSAMPAAETPGKRTSVTKHKIACRIWDALTMEGS